MQQEGACVHALAPQVRFCDILGDGKHCLNGIYCAIVLRDTAGNSVTVVKVGFKRWRSSHYSTSDHKFLMTLFTHHRLQYVLMTLLVIICCVIAPFYSPALSRSSATRLYKNTGGGAPLWNIGVTRGEVQGVQVHPPGRRKKIF